MGELERATGAVLVPALDANHAQLQVGGEVVALLELGGESSGKLAYGAREGEVAQPETLEIRDGVVTAVFSGIDLPVAITATADGGDVIVDDLSLGSL